MRLTDDQFTRKELENLKIIFNHVPKTGGSSMQVFFKYLFGKDRVFRVLERGVTDILTIEGLSVEQREHYKVFQGHFRYGYHSVIGDQSLYFGIMRDPIDRIISNYFYTREKGRDEVKQYAMSVTLDEYVEKFLSSKGKNFGSAQTNFLTKTRNTKRAREILRNEYFLVCTTSQVNRCQELLSLIFERRYKKRVHTNKTDSGEKGKEVRDAIKKSYHEFFRVDYNMLGWIERSFDTIYANRNEWIEKFRAQPEKS